MTTQIQEYSATEAALAELRERIGKTVHDVTTTKGMDAAKKDRAEVRGYRTSLEKLRVELKAPALERSRLIDAEAKRITAELQAIEGPIDEQIKSEEKRKEDERLAKIAAEEARVAGIRNLIASTFTDNVVALARADSVTIAKAVAAMTATPIGDEYAELATDAERAKADTLAKLDELCGAAAAREAEEARLKAEREELARLREADAKRVAAEKAESDRLAKIESDRVAAERAENDRIAKVERDRIAAEKAEIDRVAAANQKRLDDERAAFEKQQADARAENERIAAQQKAEREAIERAKAPPPAPAPEFTPTADQIVAVVAQHFNVAQTKALSWLERLFVAESA